jgi:hypothetical protein
MKQMMFILLAAVLVSTAFTTIRYNNPAYDGKEALQNLKGTYKDPKPVDWGRGTFGTREFTFNKGKWTLNFILALDPEMKNQVFVFRTVGTYKVLDKSATVPDAYNAVFLESKKFVTLKTGDAQLAQAFGLAQCGFVKDVEKDISITGCSLWKSVKECNEDHDLLSLDKEGKLYFGRRPADNDMCTPEKRPTVLTPPVVRKTD